MPTYYLDSSAVVKHYQTENGTDVVEQILAEPDSSYWISRLTVVEVQRALIGKARSSRRLKANLDRVRSFFYADLQRRMFRIRRLRDFHYHSAVRLVRKYGPETTQRQLHSLDALQLAAALDLHSHQPIDYFVSADIAQCQAALAEQLNVINPEAPPAPAESEPPEAPEDS